MPKYVRIEDDLVVECLDYLPENAQGDWREAIDVVPPITPSRQIQGSHHFDISKTPVEIVWGVIDLSISDRKDTILAAVTTSTRQTIESELNRQYGLPAGSADFSIIEQMFTDLQIKRDEIQALSTHEEIDDYIQANNLEG